MSEQLMERAITLATENVGLRRENERLVAEIEELQEQLDEAVKLADDREDAIEDLRNQIQKEMQKWIRVCDTLHSDIIYMSSVLEEPSDG